MLYSSYRLFDTLASLSNSKKSITFRELLAKEKNGLNAFIVRCDVERNLKHALSFASALQEIGINGTFFFHTRKDCFDNKVLGRIEAMNHEIGYHHECLDRCSGDFDLARDLFSKEVAHFEGNGFKLATVCAHGEAGLSKSGYQFNWELFDRYPTLLQETSIQAEVYTTVKRNWEMNYVSDVFSEYHSFWKQLEQSRRSEKLLQILIHPHRWHKNLAIPFKEIAKDLYQQAMNRIIGSRKYNTIWD